MLISRANPILQDVGMSTGRSRAISSTPITILGSKLVAWLNPDTTDGVGIEVTGTLIDQLTDLSGNGNHFTASGGARPTWASDGGQTNHSKTMFFTDPTTWLQKTTAITGWGSEVEPGFIFAQKVTGASTLVNRYAISFGKSAGSEYLSTWHRKNAGARAASNSPEAGTVDFDGTNNYAGDWTILGFDAELGRPTGEGRQYVDVESPTTGAYAEHMGTPFPTVDAGRIGTHYTLSSGLWAGYIGEIILYAGALTADERTALWAYMADWNI